jgi:hypothetical protein
MTLRYTQYAYTIPATVVFVELPAFERRRAQYLDDDAFRALQYHLMRNPIAGDAIQETGGLRKLRFADARRGKGKGGDKDEMADLRPRDRKALKAMVKAELQAGRDL